MDGLPVPGVTRLLKHVGYEVYGAGSWHRDRGKAVHLACQFLDEGCLKWETVTDEILPHVVAYERFKKDTGFKPKRIEEPLFHMTLKYGGTLDREGTWDLGPERVLLDFKSGAVSPWTGLQLAGYDLLLPPLKLPRLRCGLALQENGFYNYKPFKDHQDKNLFLSIVAFYWWRVNHNLIKTEEDHGDN
jgi:hypothetical protein